MITVNIFLVYYYFFLIIIGFLVLIATHAKNYPFRVMKITPFAKDTKFILMDIFKTKEKAYKYADMLNRQKHYKGSRFAVQKIE